LIDELQQPFQNKLGLDVALELPAKLRHEWQQISERFDIYLSCGRAPVAVGIAPRFAPTQKLG
jgi:hypothetical protein